MNIALDISPTSAKSGHRVRGTGFYAKHLMQALKIYFPQYRYNFFVSKDAILKDDDIVHYPYFDPFFPTLPLRKTHKTVVTVHDLTPLVFPVHFPAGLRGKVIWQKQKFLLQR